MVITGNTNKFLNTAGLSHLWKKIKEILDNKSDKGHNHSTSEVDGLASVAKDGDYNSLLNTPCYVSPFNISWDGDTTDLVYATTSEIPDLGSVLYYRVSNIIPNSNIVEGSKVTMIAGGNPYTLTTATVNIIDDGSNNFHLLFPAFNELLPLIFCVSTPDTITIEANGVSFSITFDEKGVYLVNSFGSYISEFYKEAKKLDIELLPDAISGKNKCPQLPIGVYVSGYVYDYMNYVVLSNYTNAYYDNITSDSFIIPIFMNENVVSTDGNISLKIVTEIDTSSLSISRYVDVSVEIAKLYRNKSYLVLVSKQSDGSWKGKIINGGDADTVGGYHADVLAKTNTANTFDGEQKYVNSSYAPTVTDSASGVGCAFKASRGLYNEALLDKIIMTISTGKIPFYKYTGTDSGQMTGLVEVSNIDSNGKYNGDADSIDGYHIRTTTDINDTGQNGYITFIM